MTNDDDNTQETASTTKSWSSAKKPENTKDINRLKVTGESTIRLVGNVLPRYVYWVTTTEGKKMPVECLDFNRDTEAFDSSDKNPLDEVPKEIFNEKPQFSYICNVIDRTDGKIKIFDLKRTVFSAIVEFAGNSDYGDPADPANGYDITIKKESTGPKPQNVKYTCLPGRSNSPLTPEEKKLELYNLENMYKRSNYEEQKTWLMSNTTFFAALEGNEAKLETAEDL